MSLAYDSTRDALFRPEMGDTVFTPGQRPSNEALCVEAARLAYYRAELGPAQVQRLQAALARVGFQLAQAWHSGSLVDAQAFGAIRPEDNTALLAFRGTEPDKLSDLGTDADVVPVQVPGITGHVHLGFAIAYQALEQRILRWRDALPAGCKLLVCGHSLGAAMAMLCAQRVSPALLLTLGCPRTGDTAFVAGLAGVPMVRVVNCCDLVPHLPPEGFGYTHPPQFLYIDGGGATHGTPTTEFIRADQFAARADYLATQAWRPGAVSVRDLADHAPHNYARAFF